MRKCCLIISVIMLFTLTACSLFGKDQDETANTETVQEQEEQQETKNSRPKETIF